MFMQKVKWLGSFMAAAAVTCFLLHIHFGEAHTYGKESAIESKTPNNLINLSYGGVEWHLVDVECSPQIYAPNP